MRQILSRKSKLLLETVPVGLRPGMGVGAQPPCLGRGGKAGLLIAWDSNSLRMHFDSWAQQM